MDCLDFGALHAVFDILQSHYPERLAVMVMFCAPFIFGALWKAVSPFIDPDTKKKVVFVNGSTAKAEIGDIFEPKVRAEAHAQNYCFTAAFLFTAGYSSIYTAHADPDCME